MAALILTGALATVASAMPAIAQDPAQPVPKDKPQASDQLITPVQTVEGKVEAYTAGKSITVMKKDGTTATFTIPEKLAVSEKVVVGGKVTIRTNPSNATMAESITVLPKY
jgi:hypothetical protein